MAEPQRSERQTATESDQGKLRRRVIERRPAMPNGRAVVGGLLVAAAAVGAFGVVQSSNHEPTTAYAVASTDIPVGHILAQEDLKLVAMDLPKAVADNAFPNLEIAIGQRTVAPLAPGNLLQRSAVVLPEGEGSPTQLSFALDAANALGGTLEVGERVDVLASFDSTGGETVTERVAEGATVAAIPEGDSITGQLVILLSLPEEADVLKVTNAVHQATITLVRSPEVPGGTIDQTASDSSPAMDAPG